MRPPVTTASALGASTVPSSPAGVKLNVDAHVRTVGHRRRRSVNVLVTWPARSWRPAPAATSVHGPAADGAVCHSAVAATPAGPSATAVIVPVPAAARVTSTGPVVSTGAASTVSATALLCADVGRRAVRRGVGEDDAVLVAVVARRGGRRGVADVGGDRRRTGGTTVCAPAMSANAVPPSVLTCHWAVNGRLPVAVAANTAGSPTQTVRAVGCMVTAREQRHAR